MIFSIPTLGHDRKKPPQRRGNPLMEKSMTHPRDGAYIASHALLRAVLTRGSCEANQDAGTREALTFPSHKKL